MIKMPRCAMNHVLLCIGVNQTGISVTRRCCNLRIICGYRLRMYHTLESTLANVLPSPPKTRARTSKTMAAIIPPSRPLCVSRVRTILSICFFVLLSSYPHMNSINSRYFHKPIRSTITDNVLTYITSIATYP